MPTSKTIKTQRKDTHHPSIAALLAQFPGETNPKLAIRKIAQEKIKYAKARFWEGPPFCPKILTSIFDIRCIEVDHEIGGDGRILFDKRGNSIIEYRSGRMIERQRFTIFHEFAHTFFPDFCTYSPRYHNAETSYSLGDREIENLCDVAAAEMLFPKEDFKADLLAAPLSFQRITDLQARYLSSTDATTHRAVELYETQPIAAVFLSDHKHDGHPCKGSLIVKYCLPGKQFKGFIPAGTSIPATSIAMQCYQTGSDSTQTVKEVWWICGKPRTWWVQAKTLPSIPENPLYPKVVVLLFSKKTTIS